MKTNIFLLFTTVLSFCHATRFSKKPFQQVNNFFGSNCDKYEDNPMMITSIYNEQCDDYSGECMEFPDSNTSASVACKKNLAVKSKINEPQNYLTFHYYLKSSECKGKEKTQAIQMRASGTCIPSMNEQGYWIQAVCGDNGVHYYAICEDEECSNCNDPYYLQDNYCYATQGLTDNYSVSISCTILGEETKASSVSQQTRKTFRNKAELDTDLLEMMEVIF